MFSGHRETARLGDVLFNSTHAILGLFLQKSLILDLFFRSRMLAEHTDIDLLNKELRQRDKIHLKVHRDLFHIIQKPPFS
jgi:hypothetical protein